MDSNKKISLIITNNRNLTNNKFFYKIYFNFFKYLIILPIKIMETENLDLDEVLQKKEFISTLFNFTDTLI